MQAVPAAGIVHYADQQSKDDDDDAIKDAAATMVKEESANQTCWKKDSNQRYRITGKAATGHHTITTYQTGDGNIIVIVAASTMSVRPP